MSLRSICPIPASLTLAVSLLSSGALSSTLAAEDHLSDLDYLTETPRRGELVAIYEQAMTDGFSYDDLQGTWTTAHRIGGEIRIAPDSGDDWSPWGGLHVAQETLKGTFDDGGTVDSSTTFIDLTGGGMMHFRHANKRGTFDPGIVLFGRAGVGFQSGSFKNVETSEGPSSGSLPDLRYELGLGSEIEMCITRRLVISGGAGINWNFANQSTVVVSNGAKTATSISATYNGFLPYWRLGLGLRF